MTRRHPVASRVHPVREARVGAEHSPTNQNVLPY